MNNERVFWDAMLYAMNGENPSKAIENQERRGQQTVVKNHRLPIKTNNGIPNEYRFKGVTDEMEYEERKDIVDKNIVEYTKQQYGRMGIKIISKYNNLFYSVELPDGWEIKATDHSMWNDLLDNNGRKRASLFYKAAFYDERAFINFEHRYSFCILPFDNYESDATHEERMFNPWKLFVTDSGERIKKLGEITPTTDEEYFEIDDILGKIGKTYLNENYPEWEDVNAYWD